MLYRGVAMAALALPLCLAGASAGHAQTGGSDALGALTQILGALQPGAGGADAGGAADDATTYVDDGAGGRAPIVHENNEWGYHDRYGQWHRAPEEHRRYMEYHHPGGRGFRPGERGYAAHMHEMHGPGGEFMRPGGPAGRPGMPGTQHPNFVGAQHPGMPGGRPGMPGHPGAPVVPVHGPAPHPTAPHPTGGTPPKHH